MSPRMILLHVGHGKTGSSFIQSSLALSGDCLDRERISYPIDEKWAALGRTGHISSGNLKPVPGELLSLARQGFSTGHTRVLISSEAMFTALRDKIAEDYSQLISEFSDCRIRILLYVRNPVEHAVSTYHQMIKRGSFTGSFADAIATYRFPLLVGQFVKHVRSSGAEVTVLNYSRHSRSLLASFEKWLGIPSSSLAIPPVETVNRSMTLAELEIQRHFNIVFGKDARKYASDPLCNTLPDIKSETPPLSRDELSAFLNRMDTMIRHPDVAAAVPLEEAYELPHIDDIEQDFRAGESMYPFAFSSDQLRVIVEAVKNEFDQHSAMLERRHRRALRGH